MPATILRILYTQSILILTPTPLLVQINMWGNKGLKDLSNFHTVGRKLEWEKAEVGIETV